MLHRSFVSTMVEWKQQYVPIECFSTLSSVTYICHLRWLVVVGQVIEGPGAYHMGLVDILQVWDW
eukprot:COSAG02_NODE_3551_length_6575_cov_5.329216_5_plen_65_part_00